MEAYICASLLFRELLIASLADGEEFNINFVGTRIELGHGRQRIPMSGGPLHRYGPVKW